MNSLQRFFSVLFLLMLGFCFLSLGGEEAACVDDFEVEMKKDCFEFWITQNGYYKVSLRVKGGTPPYTLSGSKNDTLESEGTFGPFEVYEGTALYFVIEDAEGNQITKENDANPPCGNKGEAYCPEFWYEKNITCIEGNKAVIHGVGEEAYWISQYYGEKFLLEEGDTIPSRSYVYIPLGEETHFDTIIYCFEALSDWFYIKKGEWAVLDVLANDYGDNIYISKIGHNYPSIDDTTFLDSTQTLIHYKVSSETNSFFDQFEYVITNEFGETRQNEVTLVFVEIPSLSLQWEEECFSNSDARIIDICIEGGEPPFTFTFAGAVSDEFEEREFSLMISGYEGFDTKVTDSVGNSDSLNVPVLMACYNNYCYDAYHFDVYHECLENGDARIVFDIPQGLQGTFKHAYYLNYGSKVSLNHLDTIPQNRYYYVEIETWGHADGWTLCPSEIIEAVNDTLDWLIPNSVYELHHTLRYNDDGDGILISGILETPNCGTLQFDAKKRTLLYQSPTSSCGEDRFQYEIMDAFGGKDTAQVMIYFELFEAENDTISVTAGYKTKLNHRLFSNDTGYELFFSNIVEAPQCGTVSFEGENMYYQSPAIPNCYSDIFRYEVTDVLGDKDTASVVVNIYEQDFWVEYECVECDLSEDYYISIIGGIPPYTLSGDLDTVITEMGFFQFELFDLVSVHIWIEDAVGAGEEILEYAPCNCKHVPCKGPNYHAPYSSDEFIVDCNGNGTVIPVYGGFWIDPETGESHAFSYNDTIPDLVYTYSSEEPFAIDTFINCITPNDDFYELLFGIERELKVMENDQGQEIYISDILQYPSCGEITYFYNSRIKYRASENVECVKDSFVYEITNAVGQKDTATVWIDLVVQKPLSIEWEQKCINWDHKVMDFYIDGGVPPFDIEGFFTEPDVGYREFELFTYTHIYNQIKITDSLGNSDSLNIPPLLSCEWGNCYDGLNFEITTECIGSQQSIVETNIRPKYKDIVVQSFWLDTKGKQHPLQIPIDTIPNHSYYYVELATLGHWDGYTQCLTTDIAETPVLDSSSLQIFPNPNRGVFNYLIANEKIGNSALQLKVYNAFGQLIWEGRGTANKEQRIEQPNMASGLYLIEVRSAEQKWVEKFWVE